MSIQSNKSELELALSSIPSNLRTKIISSYFDVIEAYSKGDHVGCNVKAGRFSETMLRVLQNILTGTNIKFSEKIKNFKKECEKLEEVPKTAGPEGLRLITPRALQFLYSIRNKRDSGHVGGEVDANFVDSNSALNLVNWCLCELIRCVHSVSIEEAQSLLSSISQKNIPIVWSIQGKKRVLNTKLTYAQKTLVLLYGNFEEAILVEDLFSWVEYSNLANFKSRILKPLHDAKLIEYDIEIEMVFLSPKGIVQAEKLLKLEDSNGK